MFARTPTTLSVPTPCVKADNSHASFAPAICELSDNGSEPSNLEGAAEGGCVDVELPVELLPG